MSESRENIPDWIHRRDEALASMREMDGGLAVPHKDRAMVSSSTTAWKRMQEYKPPKPDGGNEMPRIDQGPGASPFAGRDGSGSLEKAAETLQQGAEKLSETFSNPLTIAIISANG